MSRVAMAWALAFGVAVGSSACDEDVETAPGPTATGSGGGAGAGGSSAGTSSGIGGSGASTTGGAGGGTGGGTGGDSCGGYPPLFYENFDDQSNDMHHVGATNGSIGNVDPPHAIVNENYDGGSGYCARIRFGYDGTGLYDQWVDVGESSTGRHILSYWYRVDGTYDWSTQGMSHKNVRFWHSADPSMQHVVMEMHFQHNLNDEFNFSLHPVVDGANQGNVPVTGNYRDTDWHHVEIRLRYDSPPSADNGEIEVYIDHVQVAHATDKNLVKDGFPSYTRFSIPSNKSASTDPDYYYVDEVEIRDSDPPPCP